MNPELLHIGYFISPPDGAPKPYTLEPDRFCIEWINVGRVYPPAGDRPAGPGWMFLHRSGQHTVHQSPPGEHYECMVTTFSGRPPADWPRAVCWDNPGDAAAFCRDVLHACHHLQIERPLLGRLILAQFAFRSALDTPREHRRDIPAPIRAILTDIETDPGRSLSVSELAARAGWSESYLHARFRETLGLPPHQYILQERMRAARHRLVTTQDPVKVIALDLGFSSPESFCRAFKQAAGRTPATFRRRYRHY